MILNKIILNSIDTITKKGIDSKGNTISLKPLFCYLVKNNDSNGTHEVFVTDKNLNISKQTKGDTYEGNLLVLNADVVNIKEDINSINNNINQSVLGVLKVGDPAPTIEGKYELVDIGWYGNLVPIIPFGENTPTNIPIITEEGFYNTVYFDGTNYIQSKVAYSVPLNKISTGATKGVNSEAVDAYLGSPNVLLNSGFKEGLLYWKKNQPTINYTIQGNYLRVETNASFEPAIYQSNVIWEAGKMIVEIKIKKVSLGNTSFSINSGGTLLDENVTNNDWNIFQKEVDIVSSGTGLFIIIFQPNTEWLIDYVKFYKKEDNTLQADIINLKSKMLNSQIVNGLDISSLIKRKAGFFINKETGKENRVNGYSATDFINISEVTYFEMNPNAYNQFAYYDENKNLLSGAIWGTKFVKKPNGASYIRFTIKDGETFVFKPYKDRIIGEATNKLNIDFSNQGFYISALTGALSELSSYSYSDFIPVKAGDIIRYKLNGWNFAYPKHLTFFNTQQSYIGGNANSEINTVAEDGFIIFSTETEYFEKTVLTINNTDLTLKTGNIFLTERKNVKGFAMQNFCTVSADGGGDFKTINEAVNYGKNLGVEENKFTIYLMPGVYKEHVDIAPYHINIVGFDRQKCIIQIDNGDYNNVPLNVSGKNSGSNFTAYATNTENNTPAIWAYGIHCDRPGAGRSVWENCNFISTVNAGVGLGTQDQQQYEFINCRIENAGTNYDGGGLYMHNSFQANHHNMSVLVKDCIISTQMTKTAVFDDANANYNHNDDDGTTFTFINNNFWSNVKGNQEDSIYYSNAPTTGDIGQIIVGAKSYGNNIAKLNKAIDKTFFNEFNISNRFEDSISVSKSGENIIISISQPNFIFDSLGGYRILNNQNITIPHENVLYLSASQTEYKEINSNVKGTGESVYLYTERYDVNRVFKRKNTVGINYNGWSPVYPVFMIKNGGGSSDSTNKWFPIKTFSKSPYYSKLEPFFTKMRNRTQDVTVVQIGDSISTDLNWTDKRPDANERPPFCTEYNVNSYLEEKLRWKEQKYRRFDYAGVFTEILGGGVASTIEEDSNWYLTGGAYQYPITRVITGGTNAGVSFKMLAGIRRLSLIVHTDSQQAANSTVTISGGNGIVEVWNGTSWVEANGFVTSFKETALITGTSSVRDNPHTRLKFRSLTDLSEKTITVQNTGTGRFGYWGIETSPKEFMFTYICASKGSHNIEYLRRYESYTVDAFNPDLVLQQCCILNEQLGQQNRAKSPQDFANTFEIYYNSLVGKGYLVMPYILWAATYSYFIDTNGNFLAGFSTNSGKEFTCEDDTNYLSKMYETKNAPIVNLFPLITQVGLDKAEVETSNLYTSALAGTGKNGNSFTVDGIHMNKLGSQVVWNMLNSYFNF